MHLPQSLVVSLLLSLVSTLLFSRTGGVLSHRKSLTHRFPQFPPRNLCTLVMVAVTSPRLCCNGHSLLLISYLSRIGRIENSFCSACGHSSQDTSHLILHCPATDSLATLYLFTTSGPDPGELLSFWAPWSSAMLPSLGRGRVNNNNNKQMMLQQTNYSFF